jgi:glycosyltransferase involved in cell wall biosynthesis
MRILHVNKFNYRRGGAETYMQDVVALQRAAGDVVEIFAAAHPDNDRATFEADFPPYLEMEPAPAGALPKARVMSTMLWSRPAAKGMSAVIEKFKPDVIHAHNIYHHLSPSILSSARKAGVPVVMTLHDYKLACPTYQFLDKGEICQACVGGHFTQAVKRRCRNGSLATSGVMALELAVHTQLKSYSPVQVFICPSHFMKTTMTDAGVFTDRLRHLPHPITLSALSDPAEDLTRPASDGLDASLRPEAPRSLLFAGRLSREKGVDTLIQAACQLPARPDGQPVLRVAGDGPERDRLHAMAEATPGQVVFLGRLEKSDVEKELSHSLGLVLPARWFENQPMSILEAFTAGVPVIGTQLGGVPELINTSAEGDGLLVEPDDPIALAGAMKQLLDDPAEARRMGERGRAKVFRDFSAEAHLAGLYGLYAEAKGAVACA